MGARNLSIKKMNGEEHSIIYSKPSWREQKALWILAFVALLASRGETAGVAALTFASSIDSARFLLP